MRKKSWLTWLASVALLVSGWLGIFGVFDDTKTMLEVIDYLLVCMNHWTGRLAFLVIAIISGGYLYQRIFGAVSSPRRVLFDMFYRKFGRRWQFTDGTVENMGWNKIPEGQRVTLRQFDTLDAIPQQRAVRIESPDVSGLGTQFVPEISNVRCVEFLGRFSPDSKCEVHLVMRQEGRGRDKHGTLEFNPHRMSRKKSGGSWETPSLKREYRDGWVSLLCDVPGEFARTFGTDGCELIGVTRLHILGDADIAEVSIRKPVWDSSRKRSRPRVSKQAQLDLDLARPNSDSRRC